MISDCVIFSQRLTSTRTVNSLTLHAMNQGIWPYFFCYVAQAPSLVHTSNVGSETIGALINSLYSAGMLNVSGTLPKSKSNIIFFIIIIIIIIIMIHHTHVKLYGYRSYLSFILPLSL